jgi:hypothetical protein
MRSRFALVPHRPRDVTPKLLFRGGLRVRNQGGAATVYFAGEDFGFYVSQFCIRPTSLGAQAIDQKMRTLIAGVDYLTQLDSWHAVQNGVIPTETNTPDDQRRYLHDGRGLSACTHVDELYQAYLIAYLVLNTIAIRPNPGSPYNNLKNQQPFGTFGGPDVAPDFGRAARAPPAKRSGIRNGS